MNPLLAALLPAINEVLDRLIPDKAEAAKAKLEMEAKLIESITEVDKAQAANNAEEAKSDNLFKSGWRPFTGWICAAAFAWHYIVQPMITFLLAIDGITVPPLNFDMDTLVAVLMGMLGLGGLRTLEKKMGV